MGNCYWNVSPILHVPETREKATLPFSVAPWGGLGRRLGISSVGANMVLRLLWKLVQKLLEDHHVILLTFIKPSSMDHCISMKQLLCKWKLSSCYNLCVYRCIMNTCIFVPVTHLYNHIFNWINLYFFTLLLYTYT